MIDVLLKNFVLSSVGNQTPQGADAIAVEDAAVEDVEASSGEAANKNVITVNLLLTAHIGP